jgi:predicted 2-oxoglutarate/Fe(II)-dependent dioxygenase YbiX
MEHKELGLGIWQYEFPEDMAKSIVDMVEQSDTLFWEKSGIGDNNLQEQNVRTSKAIRFDQVLPFWAEQVKKIYIDAVNDYRQHFNIEINQDEGLNMLRYEQTNKYDFHVDAYWGSYRVLSGLIYLNPDDYQGGETFFKYFDVKVKPEKPSIVLFPSNYVYLHAAMPVEEGVKYILVTWMNDLPVGMQPNVMSTLAKATGRM